MINFDFDKRKEKKDEFDFYMLLRKNKRFCDSGKR